MNTIGYRVTYHTNKEFYTYNRALAYKLATTKQGKVEKISTEKVKKVLDLCI